MKRKIMSIALVFMLMLNIFTQNSRILVEGSEDQTIAAEALGQSLNQSEEETKVASDAAAKPADNEKMQAEETKQQKTLIQPTRAGADITDLNLVKIIEKEVFQDGVAVPENGQIDTSKDITISFKFAIPVVGDGVNDESKVVIKGDYAKLKVASGVIAKAPLTFDLIGPKLNETDPVGKKVGTAELYKEGEETWVKINFDGDDVVFDGTLSEVTAWFSAKFKVNLAGGSGQNPTVTILEKEYETNIPTVNQYEITKKAEFDLASKIITWTIEIKGKELKGDTVKVKALDLGGFTLGENLTEAGKYVDNSLKLNNVLVDGETYQEEYGQDGNLTSAWLRYVFPAGTKTSGDENNPLKLTLETKVPLAEVYKHNGVNKYNYVELRDREGQFAADAEALQAIKYNWGKKDAQDLNDEVTASKTYKRFQWKIEVNPHGETLNNVEILETPLDGRLIFEKAYVREEGSDVNKALSEDPAYYNSITNEYTAVPTLMDRPTNRHIYRLGTVTKKTTLYIVVKREWSDAQNEYYHNSAIIRWHGTSKGADVGKNHYLNGYGKIVKEGKQIWGQGLIKWTVKVPADSWKDLQKPVVLDLLVRDPNFSFSQFESKFETFKLANGQKLSTLGYDYQVLKLRFHSNFKFKENSFVDVNSLGLKHEWIAVYNEADKHVADLLKVTVDPAAADKTKELLFTFEGYQMRPSHLLAEGSQWSSNTARLFDGTKYQAEDYSGHHYYSRPLYKEMIKNTAVNGLKTKPTADLVNQIGEGHEAFNRQTGSIIYRISINGNNHPFMHESLGDFTLTDTLPEGWEFVKIKDNKDYLVFAGEPFKHPNDPNKETGSVVATGNVLNDIPGMEKDFTDGKVVFTFKEDLKYPYVILLEARPKAEKLKEYRESGKRVDVENTAVIRQESNKNLKVEKKAWAYFYLNALNKTKVTKGGSIVWTINFNPNYVNIPDGQKVTLVDHLSEGIEVRLDPEGKPLLIGANYELYDEQGQKVELKDILTYEKTGRNLILQLPEKKEYRFIYITDVTGAPGLKISNKVIVQGHNDIQAEHGYVLKDQDAGADYTVNTYVEIHKKDKSDHNLANAEFTLKKGNQVVKVETSDHDGFIRFNKLSQGDYTIQETKAPSGYQLDSTIYYIRVVKENGKLVAYVRKGTEAENKVNQIEVINEKMGGLKIKKTIQDDNPKLDQEFTFKLTFTGTGADQIYELKKTNADGQLDGIMNVTNGSIFTLKHNYTAEIKGLPEGLQYTVEETDAGEYLPTEKTKTGTIDTSVKTLDFINRGKTEIKVVKTWDGPVLNCIRIQILANGQPITFTSDMIQSDEITFVEGSKYAVLKPKAGGSNVGQIWSYVFSNLPKYDKSGNKIAYTVKETHMNGQGPKTGDGKYYETTYPKGQAPDSTNQVEIQNTLLTSVEVSKTWIGTPSVDKVIVELWQDGRNTNKTVELSESNDWKATFDKLPAYKGNTKIQYTVKEVTENQPFTYKETKSTVKEATISRVGVENKSQEITQTYAFEIVNISSETINIPVEKKWRGTPKDQVKIQLVINGTPSNDPLHTLYLAGNADAQFNWKVEFKDLPKYDKDGKEIKYTIKEEKIDGYHSKIEGDAKKGFIVTNTELTNIMVEKKWVGPVVETGVLVQLYRQITGGSKETVGDVVEIQKDKDWKHTFTNLPVTDADGNLYKYSIDETDVPDGYEKSVKDFVITNKNISEREIKVTKIWWDDNNATGKRPANIKVILKANGIEKETIALPKEGKWEHTFKNLRKYDDAGKLIKYTVHELTLNYNTVITGQDENGIIGNNVTITNTIEGKVSIGVTKKWIGTEAAFVMVNLLADGKIIDGQELNQGNSWQYTFSGLDEYTADGRKIVYTVEEVVPQGYIQISKTGDAKAGFIFTNRNEATTKLEVEKDWHGPKLAEVKVRLLADDVETTQELTLNEGNGWKGEFAGLRKYHETDGHIIKYTVKEINLPANYRADYDYPLGKDKALITNTNTETVEVKVEKIWVGAAKDSVTIRLLQDGVVHQSQVLNAGKGWKHTFTGLEKYKKDGTEHAYTVEEEKVEGYRTDYRGTQQDGFQVINSQIPDKPFEPYTPPTPPTTDIPEGDVPQGNTPPTPPTTDIPENPVPEGNLPPTTPPEEPIDDPNIPQGTTELPKTGGAPASVLHFLGLALAALGGILRRKTK